MKSFESSPGEWQCMDEVVCPYCGEVADELDEGPPDEDTEMECGHCEKKFHIGSVSWEVTINTITMEALAEDQKRHDWVKIRVKDLTEAAVARGEVISKQLHSDLFKRAWDEYDNGKKP